MKITLFVGNTMEIFIIVYLKCHQGHQMFLKLPNFPKLWGHGPKCPATQIKTILITKYHCCLIENTSVNLIMLRTLLGIS